MITSDQAADFLRPDLLGEIERLRSVGVPKMDAYERVGGSIGRSDTWVRRVIGRSPKVTVGLHDALNFLASAHGLSPRAAYERLCARIEAAADRIDAGNDELRRELDAAVRGDQALCARTPQAGEPEGPPARGPGRAATSALVSPAAATHRVGTTARGDLNDLPLWRGVSEE